MRKVCIICENFFPHIGGVEKYFLDVAKALINQGSQVRVVTSNSGGITGQHQYEGVDVWSYAWPSVSDHAFPRRKDLREHVAWANLIHTSTYTTGPAAVWEGRKQKKPVLITVHEILRDKWAWIEPNPLLVLGYRIFETFVISRPYDYFICDSKSTQVDLLAAGIPDGMTETVYLSVESESRDSLCSDKNALCEFLETSPQNRIFLYFGRPGQPKGIFVYLEAIRQLCKNHSVANVSFGFILAKEPAKQRSLFIRQVKEYGLEDVIKVKESVSRKRLMNYVNAADFVVIPSITEGFGFTTVESCLLGKKVICSDGGSLPEVASGEVLFFQNRNSADLAAKLQYAADDGVFPVSPLKSFPPKAHWDKLFQIYDRLILEGKR